MSKASAGSRWICSIGWPACSAEASPPGSWDGVRAACADGFRLLLSRVEAEGLSPKVRARATAGPVSASPFHRIRAAGDALLAAWLEKRDPAEAATRFRKVSGECRKEARAIEQHLEGAGVSIDIVFSLEVIDRCLTRTALMTEIVETPFGPKRSRAVHRLLFRLFLSAAEDRSIRHLVGWNMKLLGRKIVDRSERDGRALHREEPARVPAHLAGRRRRRRPHGRHGRGQDDHPRMASRRRCRKGCSTGSTTR